MVYSVRFNVCVFSSVMFSKASIFSSILSEKAPLFVYIVRKGHYIFVYIVSIFLAKILDALIVHSINKSGFAHFLFPPPSKTPFAWSLYSRLLDM